MIFTVSFECLKKMSNQYKKLVICGPARSGKTTLVKLWRTQQFETKYVATMGVETHPHSQLGVTSWDCAGDEKFGGLVDGYYIKGKMAIVMIGIHDEIDYSKTDQYMSDLIRVCNKNIPIIVVCNHFDHYDPSYNTHHKTTYFENKYTKHFLDKLHIIHLSLTHPESIFLLNDLILSLI